MGAVQSLMGLHEPDEFHPAEDIHITVVDLMAWLRAPGGDPIWGRLALLSGQNPKDTWTTRQTIPTDSELACCYWDFMAAVDRLPLRAQGIVALKAFGFTHSEIAQLMHVSKWEITKTLWGDARSENVREGAVQKLTAYMNQVHDD